MIGISKLCAVCEGFGRGGKCCAFVVRDARIELHYLHSASVSIESARSAYENSESVFLRFGFALCSLGITSIEQLAQ